MVVAGVVLIGVWLLLRGGSSGSQNAGEQRADQRSGGIPFGALRRHGAGRVLPDLRVTLRGRVIYPDGTPVPGAEVVIQSGPASLAGKPADPAERDGVRKIVADSDGAFAFEKLRVGTYLLAAVHEDDVAPTTSAEASPTASAVTLVMFPGAGLEVLVRSAVDRAPLPGATVRITDGDRAFGEQWSFRTEQTDTRGIATFRGMIATASHIIAASAPGYAETTLAIHEFQFSNRQWSVEVALPRAATVSGRVVDSSGRGVANATVGWELDGVARPDDTPDLFDPHAFHGQLEAVQTDADGRFALSAVAGSGCVLATHPAHEIGQRCGVTLSTGSERSGIEIVLRDGGRVSGQVLWSDGTPAAGATVIATKRGWVHQPMQSKSYRFEARTDLDGRFAFRGIKRGELDLTAFTDDASSPLVPVDLTKQSEQKNITITLTHEGTIRGRVVDEGKNPVGYALVEYFVDPTMAPPDAKGKPGQRWRTLGKTQHADFALPRSIGATRADGEGNFEIRGLPEGLYAVKASRPIAVDLPSSFASTTEVAVGLGETVEIVMKGLGGVKGRVVADSGKPVPAFGISLAPAMAKPKRDLFSTAHRIVSADGTFSLGAIPAGTYLVRVDGEDITEQVASDAVTVVGGSIADLGTIRVVKGVRRRGVVLAKDNTPVAAARVIVMATPAAEPIRLETEDDGTFVLPPLPPDQPLRVRADKSAATSDWITVPGATTRMEIVLAKEGLGTVSGVLVEPSVALDRRSIVLTLVGEGTPDDKLTPIRNVLTTEGGAFKIDSVQAGDYLIWVKRLTRSKQLEGDIWWKQEAPIHVEPLHETQVVLPVPPRSDGGANDPPPGGSGQQGGGGTGQPGGGSGQQGGGGSGQQAGSGQGGGGAP